MARQIMFAGAPVHLVGEPPQVGQQAPAFTAHKFVPGEGLKAVSPLSLPGKARLISVVPSLDTGVCSKQTKTFNEQLGALGDTVAAYTISLDLPFAQNRFCGAEGIESIETLSDYQDRSFGTSWGLLIDELKLLARSVFVVDKAGTVVYAQVLDVTSDEPDYAAALAALKQVV